MQPERNELLFFSFFVSNGIEINFKNGNIENNSIGVIINHIQLDEKYNLKGKTNIFYRTE